jgi:outer membrane protein assembly factor BamB
VWTQVYPLRFITERRRTLVPGPFAPAIAGGRLYTRWGFGAGERREGQEDVRVHVRTWMKDLAAFDLRNGALLWTTAAEEEWRDLYPVSDPSYADGRLYVLALSTPADFAPLVVVCLDAAQGRVLWSRTILENSVWVAAPHARRGREDEGSSRQAFDIVHFGNAVTVSGDALYCATAMGAVARCDARDGLVEWVRSYTRDPPVAAAGLILRRQGSAPVVWNRSVVFLPRDASEVFACNRDSGEILWRHKDERLCEIIGAAEDLLLLRGLRRVVALDLDTGGVAWTLSFRHSLAGKVLLCGRRLLVSAPERILGFDSQSGKAVRGGGGAPPGPLGNLVFFKGDLVGTPVERCGRAAVHFDERVRVWFTDCPLRMITPVPGPIKLDGRPGEWNPGKVSDWEGDHGVCGKLLLAHDAENLYIGLSMAASAFEPQRGLGVSSEGDWLEVELKARGRSHRWGVGPDYRCRALWDTLGGRPLPEGIRAAIGCVASPARLTYEIAVPLRLLGIKALRKRDSSERIGIALVVHHGRHDRGSAQRPSNAVAYIIEYVELMP